MERGDDRDKIASAGTWIIRNKLTVLVSSLFMFAGASSGWILRLDRLPSLNESQSLLAITRAAVRN